MRVERLELAGGFFGHTATDLALPANGVVLVRGPNGAGKSALAEAVAWGLWGETLREAPPWPEGTKTGRVAVHVAGFDVERFLGRGVRLDWKATDDDAPEVHLTTTKAQEALSARIGAYDVWKRTHVLSAATLGAFTRATDAQRKRLLEVMLGVERLDAASERAREANLAAQRVTYARDVDAKGARSTVARFVAELAQQDRAPRITYERPEGDATTLRDAWREAVLHCENAEIARRVAVRERELVQVAVRACRTRLSGVAGELDDRACSRCGMYLPPEQIDALERERDEQERALRDAEAALPDLQITEIACIQSVARMQLAEREARTALEDFTSALVAYEASVRATAKASGAARLRLVAQLAQAEEDADDAQLALDRARKDETIAKQAAFVLSTYGVRAHLMRGVLGGIEAVANAWLARIAGEGVSIALGLKEEGRAEVTLVVNALGGGTTYRGLSTGQQRRVDAALLFALAEVAAGASGTERGTLWCDEAFDGLDAEGKAAVAGAIDEQAEDRAVVVITHDEALESLFRNVSARVWVEAGKALVMR